MATKLVLEMAALAAGLALIVPSAHCQEAVTRTGSAHVIHYNHLDLSQPADRLALLVQVERTARVYCWAQWETQKHRKACLAKTISTPLDRSPPAVRSAIQTARLERDSQLQAQR